NISLEKWKYVDEAAPKFYAALEKEENWEEEEQDRREWEEELRHREIIDKKHKEACKILNIVYVPLNHDRRWQNSLFMKAEVRRWRKEARAKQVGTPQVTPQVENDLVTPQVENDLVTPQVENDLVTPQVTPQVE